MALSMPAIGAGIDKSDSATSCLARLIQEEVAEEPLRAGLQDGMEVRGAVAITAAESGDQVAVGYAERMATSMDGMDRRDWVETKAVDLLLRQIALISPSVSNALSAYRYPGQLIGYAGTRLIQEVSGKVQGFALMPLFMVCDNYQAVLLVLPKATVELQAIQLVSDRETRALYTVALVREALEDLDRKQYEAAAQKLLEARKHGYLEKDLFMHLYQCYLLTWDAASARRVADLLLRDYAPQVTFSDCIQLARLAERAKADDDKNFWYGQAEKSIRKVPSLDMFLQHGGVP